MLVCGPGRIKPGTYLNGIQSHEDLFATFSAAAGDDLGTGVEHKNHIYGVNNLDYWTGKTEISARDEYIYDSESRILAIRINQ